MTAVLVHKLLRDIRWPLLTVSLILFIFSAFWVKIAQRVTTEIAPFFNVIGAGSGINKEVFDEVIFKGPGKISQAVMGGAEVNFERPNDFLAIQLLHPVVMILAALWAVGRAASAISGELDRGTMELLLSQPVPRNRLILAHFLIDGIVIPVFCLSILAGTQFGLWVVGPFQVDYAALDKVKHQLPPVALAFLKTGPETLEVSASRQWLGLVNLAGLLFALSGFTIMVSAMGRSRSRTLGVAALIGVMMFVANVIGQLWEPAAFVRPFTVFFYYQPQKIWLKGIWTTDLGEAWTPGQPLCEVPVVVVLVVLGAVGYLVALRVFTRRDLPAPL